MINNKTKTLFNRVKEGYMDIKVIDYDDYSIKEAIKYCNNFISDIIASQKEDGSWEDINYFSKSRVGWEPVIHLIRIRKMAILLNNNSNLSKNLPKRLKKGLEYWYNFSPKSENWWWNCIGKQQQLGPIGILLKGAIEPLLINKIIKDLRQPSGGGQNLLWTAQQSVIKGLLLDEKGLKYIIEGFKHMKKLLKINSPAKGIIDSFQDHEGVLNDYSFHQHHTQIYNYGYGLHFIKDLCFWCYNSRGLSFAFDLEEISILSSLILKGNQWMTRYHYADISSVGRCISRTNSLDISEEMLEVCKHMMELDQLRSEEYVDFRKHILGESNNNLSGNKHFWLSDYHTHRRPNYLVTVKTSSIRTRVTETCNSENIQGYYLSQGATYILVDGNEYFNIFPVWDWGKIPGTTTPHKDPAPEPPCTTGKKSFTGGVSDGNYGIVGFDFDWDGVAGKKSWFFFDDFFISLGKGINSQVSEPIYTTINQTFYKEQVWVGKNDKSVSSVTSGIQQSSNIEWLYHNKVGYIFFNDNPVNLKIEEQTGSWCEINQNLNNKIISKKIFSIWLNHGTKPVDKSYKYMVFPGISKDKFVSFINNVPINIIKNTTEVQAVYHNKLKRTGIVFYQAGVVQIRSDFIIAVDTECIMMLKEKENSINISIVNPCKEGKKIKVDIEYYGIVREMKINLPEGDKTGLSVNKEINC